MKRRNAREGGRKRQGELVKGWKGTHEVDIRHHSIRISTINLGGGLICEDTTSCPGMWREGLTLYALRRSEKGCRRKEANKTYLSTEICSRRWLRTDWRLSGVVVGGWARFEVVAMVVLRKESFRVRNCNTRKDGLETYRPCFEQ